MSTCAGSEGSGHLVRLPDVHLVTASSVLALSGVGVSGGRVPAEQVGLAVDELNVPGALSVTVTSSVLRTGLVIGEPRHTTILVHLDEVEGTVETTGEVGHVDIKGEFLVVHVEHLVSGGALHEVDTATNVLAERSLLSEFEGQGAAGGRDTVGSCVVGTLESAVLGAGSGVGAVLGVPSRAGVAVVVRVGDVVTEPSPVGVKGDFTIESGAGLVGVALLDGEPGVVLGINATGLLAKNGSDERQSDQGSLGEHCGRDVGRWTDAEQFDDERFYRTWGRKNW